MKKIIFTAALLSTVAIMGIHAAGAAETKVVQRTVTVYSMADAPKLEEQVKAVCADTKVKLSDKARAACDANSFPPLTKNLTFRNSGIGAEFNTLVRQRS
jgi:hypothetical protein